MKSSLLGLVTLLLLGLLGCASAGNYIMVCQISGGQTVNVLLTKNGPEAAEDDDVKVLYAGFAVNAEKKVVYTFAFQAKSQVVPTKIKLENVTDPAPELLMEDAAPKLDAQKRWTGHVTVVPDMEGNMAWLNYDTNTMRIYKFTISLADGRTLVLYQPSAVPPFLKPFIKSQLGVATAKEKIAP